MLREPHYEIVAPLVAAGARVELGWLNDENTLAHPRVFAALSVLTHMPSVFSK